MSIDFNSDDDEPDEKTVADNEGTVDQKVKQRIIDARKRVDEREDQLFVRAAAAPDVGISREQALNAWGTSVRQYIRTILPLLKSDDVKKADYYYHDVPLGEFEVPPPDGKREWSRFAYTDNPQRLADSMTLPPAFEPPEVRHVGFRGLKEILNKNRIEERWTVELKPGNMTMQQEVDHLSAEMQVPKSILEEAVSATDMFLQEAGVGLEIDSGDPHGKT